MICLCNITFIGYALVLRELSRSTCICHRAETQWLLNPECPRQKCIIFYATKPFKCDNIHKFYLLLSDEAVF